MKYKSLKKIIMYLTVSLFAIIILGCSINANNNHNVFQKVTFATNNDINAELVANKLRQQGVFISSGRSLIDNNSIGYVIISMQTHMLFLNDSANLNNNGKAILHDIINFARYYEIECIEINNSFINNDDKMNFKGLSKSLALERTNQILSYLWARKLDINFIYGKSTLENRDFITFKFAKYKKH